MCNLFAKWLIFSFKTCSHLMSAHVEILLCTMCVFAVAMQIQKMVHFWQQINIFNLLLSFKHSTWGAGATGKGGEGGGRWNLPRWKPNTQNRCVFSFFRIHAWSGSDPLLKCAAIGQIILLDAASNRPVTAVVRLRTECQWTSTNGKTETPTETLAKTLEFPTTSVKVDLPLSSVQLSLVSW